ncbi:TPA: ABC transporter permease [Vibrio cholerae]|nr:putative O-antigen ABC transporter permease [Vibrio mimicus]HAS3607706.1 ABC transporter permease [Vibrio cholerae]
MKTILSNYSLIISLTKREIENRYRNSSLGILWSVVLPLFMLAIYSFVFGFVFKSKWGVETSVNYSLMMFIGLIVHAYYADCLGKATSLIQSNANYVKKVIFPLESLCWVSLLSSLFQFFISMSVFLLFYFFQGNEVFITQLLFPIILIPMIVVSLALINFLSALSVYVRDVSHIISVVVSVMLFMSPIFYSIESVPESYRWIIYLNPITFTVEALRDSVIYGKVFNLSHYAIYLFISIMLYYLSKKWFNKLKYGFSDVI